MRLWLVSYDIADNRRRRRTANVLHTQLERVQESVFAGWLTASQARTLLTSVQTELNTQQDQLRAWPLAQRQPERQRTHGQQDRLEPDPSHWMV
jgi:CRISPR-associated protein Cas2